MSECFDKKLALKTRNLFARGSNENIYFCCKSENFLSPILGINSDKNIDIL